jgi:hypothetical protein
MADSGKLQLEVVDAGGLPIKEKIDVVMRHQILSDIKKATINGAQKAIITGLNNTPPAVYRVEVDPPSYFPVEQFVSLKPSGTTELTMVCPIDPKKIKRIDFPKFDALPDAAGQLLDKSERVFQFEGKKGKQLYDGLDDVRRAGLLNIIAKARATPLSNKTNVLSFVQELRELRGDRFFAFVSRELCEETKNSVGEGLFHKVNGALHKLPPQFVGEFKDAGSFKTGEGHGNLQLSFFTKGDECVVDVDIDDAGGLEHVFQVVRHRLTGIQTNPFIIHDILLAFQKLDPGYRFVV